VTDPTTGPSAQAAPPPATQVWPGWYPDPWQRAPWRWWDGAAWSWQTFPPDASAPSEPAGPERRFVGVAAPPQGRWGLWDVAIMIGIAVSTIIVVIIAVGVLVAGNGGQVDQAAPLGVSLGSVGDAWATIVLLVLPWLGFAGWPLLVGRLKGPGWRGSFGFAPTWGSLGWGALGGLATLVVIVVGSMLGSALLGQPIDSAAGDAALDIKNVPVAFAVMLVLISLGAPFVEELAFRGLLWGAMVKRWGRPWLATVVAGVVFGLAHLELVRTIGLIGAGIVLGFVRHKKGLAASMVSHACLNSLAALALLAS
jgi:membrane protease YdiL (CAAX protease family)